MASAVLSDVSGQAARAGFRQGCAAVAAGVRAEPRLFTGAVLASAVYGAGTVAGGWVLGRVTDTVLVPAFARGHATTAEVVAAVGPLSAVFVVTAAAVAARRALAGATNYHIQAKHRSRVTDRYLELSPAWHAAHQPGELLSVANSDVEAATQVFAPLPMAIGVVVMMITAAVAMLQADPVLGLVGLVSFPLLLVANAVYSRIAGPRTADAQACRAAASSVAHESFDAAIVVTTLGRQGAETGRFGQAADDLRRANVAVGTVRAVFDPVVDALPTLSTVLMLAVGAWRVDAGTSSTADVVQVAYLLSLVSAPIRAFGWVLGDLARSAVGWTRIRFVLGLEPDLTHGTAPAPARTGGASAHLRGVTVRHRSRPGRARAGDEQGRGVGPLDLDLPAGAVVALVGPTGVGKSTLAQLVVRLRDPDAGTVHLDGVAAPDLTGEALAQVVALAPQSAFVFDDTVAGNLTLGRDVPEADLWRVLRAAHADVFVRSLPEGLGTRLGERGTSLSGGQRQRLVLARALLAAPRLLVLDDATSAIDPRVEQRILAGLRDAVEGMTVLLIAHRPAAIAVSDEVVLLLPGPDGSGRVAARGTHDELLTSCAPYRDLVHAYRAVAR